MKNGDDLVVACTQEAPLFTELHGELKGSGAIQFVNIRETAGWSAEAGARHAQDRGAAGARRSARARAGAGGVVPLRRASS